MGPSPVLRFKIFKSTLWVSSLKRILPNGEQFFTYRIQNRPLLASMPTFRPEEYSLQYVRIDDAIRILLNLGPDCFMAKTDVKSAFCNIPVHPDVWELLGMKWRGLYFFDLVLPFDLRSAPYIFNMLSDALEWILINKLGVPNVLHILDDFFIAEAAPCSSCLISLSELLCMFTELDVPIAPGKTFASTQTLEFLGITLDSIQMPSF